MNVLYLMTYVIKSARIMMEVTLVHVKKAIGYWKKMISVMVGIT